MLNNKSTKSKFVKLDDKVLLNLCGQRRALVKPLREVVTRWRRSNDHDLWGYLVVDEKVSTWARILNVSMRSVESRFLEMSELEIIYLRRIETDEGVHLLVAPTLEVQIACRNFLLAKGRHPQVVLTSPHEGGYPPDFVTLIRICLKALKDNLQSAHPDHV